MNNSIQFRLPIDMETFIEWVKGEIALLCGQWRPYKSGNLHLYPVVIRDDKNEKLAVIQPFALYQHMESSGRMVSDRIERVFTFEASEIPDRSGVVGVQVNGRRNTTAGGYCYDRIIEHSAQQWPASGLTTLGTRRRGGGRRPNPETTWAYCQIEHEGRPIEKVWLDWMYIRGSAPGNDLDTLKYFRDRLKGIYKNPPDCLEEIKETKAKIKSRIRNRKQKLSRE